ncbi:MAG TPA: F0F1 ATP synthase subunit B' [Acetobacteraceae bacterium]|jgi:F-type H+-transporting ATPase subunit b|nr:F0F1 ATP synthase subunit B' [Acetobacteraceae bacterium]
MPARLALLAALLLAPATAWAEGMPQLDFANPLTTSQVVWGAIIFVALYLLLSRVGLPLVGEVIEERARHIAADLETARASKTRADSAAQEVAEATARARAEAQAAINAALDAAKGEAAARIATLNERLEKQLQDAEAQIGAARAAAMRALREVATETAATVIARLTGSPADQQRLDGAVGAALAARRIS